MILFSNFKDLANCFKLGKSGPSPTKTNFILLLYFTNSDRLLIILSKLFSEATLPTEPITKSSDDILYFFL